MKQVTIFLHVYKDNINEFLKLRHLQITTIYIAGRVKKISYYPHLSLLALNKVLIEYNVMVIKLIYYLLIERERLLAH